MSKESRRKKKEQRKLNRKERKEAFAKFLEAVTVFKSLDLKEKLAYKEKFNQVWPAIKPTLEFAIILKVTGEGFDSVAKQIVAMGDNLSGKDVSDAEALAFITKFGAIWANIGSALDIVKAISNDQTDEVIDKIIEIGDWLLDQD